LTQQFHRPPADERCIAHLDMDAFYASVELLRHPELRGLPVAIGGRGDPSRRGVVTTANYEARVFGIRSAMALHRAHELCPQCVFLPVDFDEYRRFSKRFKQAVAQVCPTIEDRGIDEVYIDLSELHSADVLAVEVADAPGSTARAAALGMRLKQAVLEATGLSCSVGIAPNKLLAKIASDLNKPDGLSLIAMTDIEQKIWPLPVRRINGIGPKADARLAALGIRLIGELAVTDPQFLLKEFGKSYGRWLHEASNGRDERPLVTFSEPKSLSRETTFERDLHLKRDWHTLAAILARLCQQVSADLGARRYRARTVGVKVRFDDFQILTRDLSLTIASADAVHLRKAAFECLARVPEQRSRIRLIGVRASNLIAATAIEPADVVKPARPAKVRSQDEAKSRNLSLF
jgi:DNA polymerase IV